MPGFFDTFNPSEVLKEAIPIALSKQKLDMEMAKTTRDFLWEQHKLDVQTKTARDNNAANVIARTVGKIGERDPDFAAELATKAFGIPVGREAFSQTYGEELKEKKLGLEVEDLESKEHDRSNVYKELVDIHGKEAYDAMTPQKRQQSYLALHPKAVNINGGGKSLIEQVGGQENLDFHLARYVKYGVVPPMGMGGNNRWEFLGKAAKWAKENGFTEKSAQISSMSTKAAQGALNNLEKVESVSGVAGETAIKHGETAFEIMDKKDRIGSPVLDRWIRAGKKSILGDPDVAAFDISLHMFNRELARYLTSMTSGGVMAQKEADEINELIGPNQSPRQMMKNLPAAKRLIKEKEGEFRNRLNSILNGVGGPGGADSAPGSGRIKVDPSKVKFR